MSYYCHECAQRRDLLYNPLSCAVCGSEMIDSIPIISEESSEEEELQEFFSEIDLYYNILAQEQAQDEANFDEDEDEDEDEDDDEEALEERCLFEQLSSMYNHPIARNFTSTSTNPFTTSPRSDTTPTTNRRLADRLFQEAQREEREEEEEEVTEDEQDRDIISYDVRFEQRTMNDENELDPPDADRTWEASILPQPETESLFQLPFTRFGRLLDTMYNYRSDDDSDEGESNYHRRSFLDNLADILSDYTSEVRQQQTPNTPASTVDAIVKSLKISCLDPSDPAVHDECIICQEMYGSTNEIFHLPCQHKYHGVCITKWFTVNVSCPICRHPADKDQQYEQAQPNQEVHEEQQERQQHSTHPSASTDSAVSTPPLPSSASSSILQAGRLTFVELDSDQFETESDQSENVEYEGSQINSEQSQDEIYHTDDDSFEDIVNDFERSISSALLSRSLIDANVAYEGLYPANEQNREETVRGNIESSEERDGAFHRSIATILTPNTLDTIPLNYSTSSRNGNRYFQPTRNSMDQYVLDQFRASRSPIMQDSYDHGASDNTNTNNNSSSMMDWRYNSSMEEVD